MKRYATSLNPLTQNPPRARWARAMLVLLITIFVCMVPAPLPQAQSSSETASPFVRGEIIVEIKEDASISEINERNRTETIENLHGTNFYRLRIPANKSEKKWRKRLAADPDVRVAALNPIVNNPFITSGRAIMSYPDGHAEMNHTQDDYRSQNQIVATLNPEELHLRSHGDGIVIAVIDTGVDKTHPAIAPHLWKDTTEPADGRDSNNDGFIDDSEGWDFVDNDNDASEAAGDPTTTVAGHGTFIAGLIALLAPDAKIMPIRAFTPAGQGHVFGIAAAMKFAADHGADIINMSFGSKEDSQVLRSAIAYAKARNALIFAAAGNQDTDEPQYPATLNEEVIGVGALDALDRKAYFSNYGSNVVLNAIGVKLISAYPGGGYVSWNGTSFATPVAAASAALILAADPNRANVRKILEETALNLDAFNPTYAGKLGQGRIDPLAALQFLVTLPALDLYAATALVNNRQDAESRGQASIYIAGDYQGFTVEASGLEVHKEYRLYVDGVLMNTSATAGNLTTDDFGGLKIDFVNYQEKRQQSLPAPLKPVNKIRHVALHDANNRLVMQNEFAAVTNAAPPGLYFAKEARLTSALPRFAGSASLQVYESFQSFKIKVERLANATSYQIIVDGINLGNFTPKSGLIEAEFTSDGSSGLVLPNALMPVVDINRVELLDPTGRVILQGRFLFVGGKIG